MRDGSEREPSTLNVEGAPTLMYEVWDWVDSDKSWKPLPPEACHYRFIGYRVLSLRQVLKYADFGYHVERSKGRDHCGTAPLFPRLGATGPGSREWLD
jgi:hypothetical protein